LDLDTDLEKIPKFLLDFEDPIFEFNKRIIDATHDLCVAYKPNIAFYECHGSKGWDSLKKTMEYIPKGHLHHCRCKTWRHWKYINILRKNIF
jgi:orotidine-5'-phosphate decarboxylase